MKLHFSNFSHEMALADGHKNYYPTPHVRMMEHDLMPLAFWMAQPGDAILVEQSILEAAREFYEPFSRGISFVSLEQALPADARICPWGWNHQVTWTFHKKGIADLPSDIMLDHIRQLASRQTAVTLLRRIHEAFPHPLLCGESLFCTSEDAIRQALSLYPQSILKAPWSSSGRGISFSQGLWKQPLSGWCRNLLEKQGGVVVEPHLNRLSDFAAEFLAHSSGKVTYQGFSLFETTSRCSYIGNHVASQAILISQLFSQEEAQLFHQITELLTTILPELIQGHYEGPLGVDMMLCDFGGTRKLHPCVEINLRNTMGHFALCLADLISPTEKALMQIHYEKDPSLLAEKLKSLPHEETKLLTPLLQDTHFAATLTIRKQE